MSRFARTLQALGLSLLVGFVLLAFQGRGEARMDPYYVLRGLSSGDVRPQILFVVDTSGSMTWRAQASNAQCSWGLCEGNNGTEESRLSAARRVINTVIDSTKDSASFSLMTFDRYDPPTSTPALCSAGNRFHWVTQYRSFSWAQIFKHGGGLQGTWRLCQGNQQRPYPYLRWDELGVGSTVTSNNLSGELPPSPLIGSTPEHADNATRRVQWFPRFMGVRAQLNDDTDPDRTVLDQTYGDYGSTWAARNADVWRQDFYYWPYVDGFPHYAHTRVWPYEDGRDYGGVVGEVSGVSEAKLYAPFYLDLSDNPAVAAADWGPASPDAALQEVMYKTAPLIEGGIDASGGTPWASVVGTVGGSYTLSNTEGSHNSVASYLSFVTEEATGGLCAPTAAVLLTDGVPSSGQGGALLYGRLADLRSELGVKVYVVGFFQNSGEINNMACAAAGACTGSSCSSPCDDTPTHEWDTCADPDDPGGECAYLANSSDELSDVLTSIVTAELDVDLPSGPGTSANEFGVGALGAPGQGEVLQTSLTANTRWPGWRGSVQRELCQHRDEDGELLPQCRLPSPEWALSEVEETFGPCPQSHVWDAGECLQSTAWNDRRVFTTDGDGALLPVSEADGTATAAFRTELQTRGLISGSNLTDKADAVVAFMLGRDWPDGWKLPGLASSAPTLIRRVPPLRTGFVPSVAIRDPHCGGRRLSAEDAGGLPDSLQEFARSAWGSSGQLASPSQHYEYQEAVLVGDDMGMLHAFQYNSGNELWGFVPNALLAGVVEQSAHGAASVGQPEALEDHLYGISATVNAGYVYDDSDPDEEEHRWRHLALFGFGPGGSDYVALDLSHMSPESSRDPVEVLWSTDDDDLTGTYEDLLGETWARPALTFHVEADEMSNEPDPLLVMGSGYQGDAGGSAGRHLLLVDALTGELQAQAQVPAPVADTFDDDFGLVVDPAVGTHCLSRFWAEAQETYVPDPSGRLFRWDLSRTTDHEADSGGEWGATALSTVSFPSCTGAGATCTIAASNPGEPFLFAPAVTANDRIDDQANAAGGLAPEGEDQFLVALISGSHNDSAINPQDGTNEFHSSLYLLVDDHRSDPSNGFDVPPGAPKTNVGSIGDDAAYLRLALTDISRTRSFVPYPGAETIVETRNFSAVTRPIRSPRIEITGVADTTGDDAEIIDGVEVATITYFVHEPPVESCDPRFYDADNDTWYIDQGASFEIGFRLTVDSVSGFNFSDGAGDDLVDFEDGGFDRGLMLAGVEQAGGDDCEDGNCGPQPSPQPMVACDNNSPPDPSANPVYSVPLAARQLRGFTPVEGS